MWDKWTPGVAARSLLMPLLGCVGWPWHCGPDGEDMAGSQMPGFSLLVTFVWGQIHSKGRAWFPVPAPAPVAASFSPTGMWGCGHWDVASSDFPSNTLFLQSVGHEPQTEILFSCVFPRSSAPHGMALHGGKTGGLQGFGLVLLSSHHP